MIFEIIQKTLKLLFRIISILIVLKSIILKK